MCGIAGLLAFDDRLAIDEPTVRGMTDTLRHRGPDDSGVVVRAAERWHWAPGGCRSSTSRAPAISR